MTVRKAARRVGLSPGRLREAIRAGELRGYRPGKRWIRIWEPELIGWIRSTAVPVDPAAEAHAKARVTEILAAERGVGSSGGKGVS
jgi:excisionase family DNA binding protein